VACMGEERKGGDRDFVGKTKRKRPLEDWGIDRRIRADGPGDWLGWGLNGFSWLRIGAVAGSCKYGDDPAGSGATESVSLHSTCFEFSCLIIRSYCNYSMRSYKGTHSIVTLQFCSVQWTLLRLPGQNIRCRCWRELCPGRVRSR
jgi:hypothetical protein